MCFKMQLNNFFAGHANPNKRRIGTTRSVVHNNHARESKKEKEKRKKETKKKG